jgi:hypothetical protein
LKLGRAALSDDSARQTDGLAAAEFAQRILQIVNDAALTSTYKLGLLLCLMDVCLERAVVGNNQTIEIRELANKMVDLYWQQTLPYPGQGEALQQAATPGQAKIVSRIQRFRIDVDGGQPLSVARVKVLEPSRYRALVHAVGGDLCRYVLLKLQTIGGTSDPFIYDLPAGADPRGQGSRRMFAGGLHLRADIATYLVRFEPVLRPLIQQRWAQYVSKLRANSILYHVYELEQFLFGAERVSLALVVDYLRDLQHGRCFYCGREIRREGHVDHFIPWSRYRDDGLDNLVLADRACNTDKQAYLAGAWHLESWLTRFRPDASIALELAELSSHLKWARQPSRTFGAAGTAYAYATPATLFWTWGDGLHHEDLIAVRRMFATARA